MDLRLVANNGIPQDCIISVRAGTWRRQTPATNTKPMRFPKITMEESPLKVDIPQPVASSYIILRPGGYQQYKASFEKNSNAEPHKFSQDMSAEFHIGEPDGDANDNLKDEHHKTAKGTANEAKEYLETHCILEFVQALLQTVIKEKPPKPYEYMARHISCGYEASDVKTPLLDDAFKMVAEPAQKRDEPIVAVPVDMQAQAADASREEADAVDRTQAAAATKIEATFRGQQARKEIEKRHQAASKIEANFRGQQTRKDFDLKKQARFVLESALLDEGTEEEDIVKARSALEAAMHDDDTKRAQEALEAAMHDDDTKRAQEALEAAMHDDDTKRAQEALEASMLGQSEFDDNPSQEVVKKARDALTQAMLDEEVAAQVLKEPSAEEVEQIRQTAQAAVMASLSMQQPGEQESAQPLEGSIPYLTDDDEQEEERVRESAQLAIFSLVGNDPDEERAAVKIGAVVRGQQTRKRLQDGFETVEMEDVARENLTQAMLAQVRVLEHEKQEEAAAVKISASVRGQQTRKRLEEARMAEERREHAQNAMVQALLMEADEPAYFQPDLPTIPEGICEDSTNVPDVRPNDALPVASTGRALTDSEIACEEAMRRANEALRTSSEHFLEAK